MTRICLVIFIALFGVAALAQSVDSEAYEEIKKRISLIESELADLKRSVHELSPNPRDLSEFDKPKSLTNEHSIIVKDSSDTPPPAAVSDTPAFLAKEDTPPPVRKDRTAIREQYEVALNHLHNQEYSLAEDSFTAFLSQYPDDPLTSNVFYWLGENYYAQKQYARAAVQFLEGYNSFPEGSKAPDNLLKLAIALKHLNKNDDACNTLNKLAREFPNASLSITRRIQTEFTELGCV